MCAVSKNSTMFDPYKHFADPLAAPVEIIPAILAKRFRDVERQLLLVHEHAPHVQIDVVDGEFAHPASWPSTDRDAFEAIVKEEHGLPFWGELEFEFDLMLQRPHDEVRRFVRAGASRIVLHVRSEHVLDAFQTLIDLRQEGGDFAVAVGVAMLPTDQLDVLEPFEAQFDFIQVMGIDEVGKQGQPFNPQAIHVVERLRHRYPRLQLQVDGGVTKEHARALVEAGANRLIVGSAIFGAKDPLAALAELQGAVR